MLESGLGKSDYVKVTMPFTWSASSYKILSGSTILKSGSVSGGNHMTADALLSANSWYEV